LGSDPDIPKKEMLLSTSFFGNENIDFWKKVIVNLNNFGVRPRFSY
jgi:hypothetical protein